MVVLGGGIGAVLRYLVTGFVSRIFPWQFPWGTLAVNTLGSFAMGFLWAFFEEGGGLPSSVRVFLMIGLLGSFTTFSTFSLENFVMLREREYLFLGVNIGAHLVLGLLGLFLGIAGARSLQGMVH